MLITIGKCHRSYLYILGSALFKFLSITLLGSNTNNKDLGLFGFCTTVRQFNFIQSIIIYFGYIILGIIFFFFKKIKKEEQNEMKVKGNNLKMEVFIYNDPNNINEKKLYKNIILLSISFVLYMEIRKVLYIEGIFFNFWTFEIIFLLLLMKKYFDIDFYLHHKVSIIFIVSVCSSLLIAESFLPNFIPGEYSGNSYQNIKNKFGSYYYCILFIIIFVALSFVFSYVITYMKVLTQIKFISPFKIIIFFGIIGFPLSIIASIVSYYIGYRDNMFSYFSAMKAVLNGEKKYKFWVEIFGVYPLFCLTNFFVCTCEALTIYYNNPFYILMVNNILFFITDLINFSINPSRDGLKIARFLTNEFAEIFSFLGYIVFLEILELNFCGLSDNISKNLSKKGDMEFKKLSKIRETNPDESQDNEFDDSNRSSEQFTLSLKKK